MSLAHILLAVTDGNNLNTLSPLGAPADSIRDLFYLVTAIIGVIFLLVGGMLVYCIARFRQKPGDLHEPPQFYGSQPIEVAWTLAPILAVFVLFLVIVRSVVEVRQGEAPPGALTVQVRGHQWWWEYEYPTHGVITANELHVPVNTPIFLKLESADVVHSFWLPRLAGKTDVIPGRTNTMWFRATQEGMYQGNCAEYCGTQHANMLIRAVVDSDDDFHEWLDRQKGIGSDSGPRKGRTVFLSNGCVNCHTVRGTVANGTFGPDLTHLASRQTLASALVPNDKEWLSKWVHDPQKVKPGCWMPAFQLGEDDMADLIGYLESLK